MSTSISAVNSCAAARPNAGDSRQLSWPGRRPEWWRSWPEVSHYRRTSFARVTGIERSTRGRVQ